MVTGQLCDIDTDDITSMSSLTSLKESVAVKTGGCICMRVCILSLAFIIIITSFCSYTK